MKNWVYEVKCGLYLTFKKKWKQIISFFLAEIGTIYTLSQIIQNIFKYDKILELLQLYFWVILIVTPLVSIIINYEHLKFSRFIENTDIQITLKIGNVLKQKTAIVIPTNTTFDTLMDDEFISIKSVQGQFQEKYYHNNLKELDDKMENALKEKKDFKKLKDRKKTKDKQYDIGTVCKVTSNTKHIYFLAICHINKFGKPENATMDGLTSSLVNFWQYLNEQGHLETISLPLIGTGRAGIQGATRDAIIKEIIFTFIMAAREMKVTENLTICIHPSDFSQKNLHWEDMCEYLSYMCKFSHPEKNNKLAEDAESGTLITL